MTKQSLILVLVKMLGYCVTFISCLHFCELFSHLDMAIMLL